MLFFKVLHGELWQTIFAIVYCFLYLRNYKIFFARLPHYTKEEISKLSEKSGNTLHGPFDLSAVLSTKTHIVGATICTYETNRTLPSDRVIVIEVRENNAYIDLFNSRIVI